MSQGVITQSQAEETMDPYFRATRDTWRRRWESYVAAVAATTVLLPPSGTKFDDCLVHIGDEDERPALEDD